jgi:aryl-alcohol dehydrogenase-like predicted oxidoreductase
MRYTLLGKSGLRVSGLCLGTMGFMEGLGWGTSRAESRKVYDAFVEGGGNFIDTANTYGDGMSEDFLGEFVGADRDRLVLTTKYGGQYIGKDTRGDLNRGGGHRKSLVQALESSLRRLKTTYVDILWLHAWDVLTPAEEVLRALDDVIRQGKVLYGGVSNAPAWVVSRANTIAEMLGWSPFVAMQIEYNLIERDAERELMPMARALEIGCTAWTPLASGLLTGKYAPDHPAGSEAGAGGVRRLDDPGMSRFAPRTERNMAIAAEVVRVSREVGRPAAHVALNWLYRRGAIPIFGARNAEQVRENMGALDFELGPEYLARLDEVGKIKLGFPHDFLGSGIVRRFLYGGLLPSVDSRRLAR